MSFRIVKWLLGVILLGLVVVGAVAYHLEQTVHAPINVTTAQTIRVTSGQSANGMLNQMRNQGVIEQNLGLKVRLKLQPELGNIKVGTYQIEPGMTGLDVLTLLSSGKEMQFTVSLIEGLRWQDWQQVLLTTPSLSQQEHLPEQVNTLLKSIKHDSLEGLLMPDTYAFTENTPAIEIVKRAYTQMQVFLEEQWLNRALDLPYDEPYQALIMASIVEKETGLASERPHIAGVFVNRLNQNMRLQTDPTVIYGMGENFDGDIRRKDLRTATPYNTYVIKGLPPTPIAMVGKHAVQAALNPLNTEDLYFVSKGDGSHKFSKTLREHNQAVRQYQLKK